MQNELTLINFASSSGLHNSKNKESTKLLVEVKITLVEKLHNSE